MSHQVLLLLHPALLQLLSQSGLRMHHLHTVRFQLCTRFCLQYSVQCPLRYRLRLHCSLLCSCCFLHWMCLCCFRIHRSLLLPLPLSILLPSFFSSSFFPPNFKNVFLKEIRFESYKNHVLRFCLQVNKNRLKLLLETVIKSYYRGTTHLDHPVHSLMYYHTRLIDNGFGSR